MTSSGQRLFPPNQLSDLSRASASNFIKLLKRIPHGITLVLGAGVSSSAGIPSWNRLLEQMCAVFFEHWRGTHDRPPTKLSIALTYDEECFSEKAKALGKQLASKDLLIAAQQIKNCMRPEDFRWLLRHTLFDPLTTRQPTSALIEAISRLCKTESANVKSLISYNYDDLVASSLREFDVPCQLVYEKGKLHSEERGLPVYFVHGISTMDGGHSSRIVLAETDYQEETASPFSWGNQIQLQHFLSRSCVFIGNSMTDPKSRRLLRLARTSSNCPHFYFVSESNDRHNAPFETLFDYDWSRLKILPIRFPQKSKDHNEDPYSRLPELVDLVAKASRDPHVLWE